MYEKPHFQSVAFAKKSTSRIRADGDALVWSSGVGTMHAHYILSVDLQLRQNSRWLWRNRYLRDHWRNLRRNHQNSMRRQRISECLRGQGDDLHANDMRATG